MSRIELKWRMVNKEKFTAEHDGYNIVLNSNGKFGCATWQIIKDGLIIEDCFNHSPTKGELQGKVQVERVLYKILN